jgi:elongation factor Ts
LVETDGDIEAAAELMRKSGAAKADKKAGRVAADGAIKASVSDDGKSAVILEINSETDFVAKDDNFQAFQKPILSPRTITSRPSPTKFWRRLRNINRRRSKNCPR